MVITRGRPQTLNGYSNRNHKNGCVFDMANPNMETAITKAKEEGVLWKMAGDRSLSLFMAPIPGL
jgi:hypothetical protein